MFLKLLSKLRSFFNFLYCVLVTLPRDVRALATMIRIEGRLKKYENECETSSKIFSKLAAKQPTKPCFIFENTIWTFQDVEIYTNKIANVFYDKYGLRKGDVVALFMENKPEYACIWLGLSRIGVISALINTNLRSNALKHCIEIAKSKLVIYGSDLSEFLQPIKSELDKNMKYVVQGGVKSSDDNLEALLKNAKSDMFISNEVLLPSDILLYIYTSGTTGLPKPAIIKHSRFIGAGYTFFNVAHLNDKDRIYVTLPIYHANGGLIGVGCAFISGGTVVLKRKFSASAFWKDCFENKCTALIYVGEICRYLVNQPPSEFDRKHSVRVAIGNGLRENVWREFEKRFGVRPVEFYAASEGNCTIINLYGKTGACGFVPVLNRFINALPLHIIRVDNNMNPIRDENNYCIRCKPYEKGVGIGLIGNTIKTAYSGYANNKKESDKKILENVFRKGQKAFNSGDLLMCDEYGWIYFCDRLGDTFRWKGENVSTIEVENIISSKLNSVEVVVYGVAVPHQEGRAGMATIINKNLNINELSSIVSMNLPAYARPLFVRLVEEIEHTGSFKAKKNILVDEGYDINKIKDKLYFYDSKEQKYVTLTPAMYQSIQNSTLKV